ncbi:hypothetical protein LTA6_001450 [Microbacterium sp. LTA6]|uniref:hypothetical protein n=1 Tax=Microbacterium sp. LTA6 TaxID=3129771 RepID=UPI0032494CE7
MRMTGRRRRMLRLAALATAGLVLSACAPQVGDDDWTLEPIGFHNQMTGRPGDTFFGDTPFANEPRIDVAFGMSMLAADGTGGFWAMSAGSWLHLGADGEKLARFNTEFDDPLTRIKAISALSSTELAVVRDDGHPVLAVLDTTTMTMRDLPGEPPTEFPDFGDFVFGDVAVHDGGAIVVRYQPRPPAYMDYEVLRIDLDDGERELLYGRPLALSEADAAPPAVPPIDVDVDASGRIYLATPTARIVLDPDGTERIVERQDADLARVAVRPDGVALWWGGAPGPPAANGVIVGGSGEARASIELREGCAEPPLYRADALRMTDGMAEHPLPFLCGANAAVWTGSSWVVAIGGEGDGVLVRLTPPAD